MGPRLIELRVSNLPFDIEIKVRWGSLCVTVNERGVFWVAWMVYFGCGCLFL